MDKFSALALSTFFKVLTHGYSFQNTRCQSVGNSPCTFTKIFLSICWDYSIAMFLRFTNVKLVKSAGECPSNSSVTLQLRDANTTIYFWSVENYKDFTLCPGLTVASTSRPKQCLKSLEFAKQLPDVMTQKKWDILCKLDVNFQLLGI